MSHAQKIRQFPATVLVGTRTMFDSGAFDDSPYGSVIILTDTGERFHGQPGGAPAPVATGVKDNLGASGAPTAANDGSQGYAVGSRWVDVASDESYICVDAAQGAAVWSLATVGTIGEVAGLQTALDAKATTSALTAHTGSTANPHAVTKAQVGLGSADNTADAAKPVSTAQQTALDAKQAALVSGTNIRTVGGASLLGAGDVAVPVDVPGTQPVTATDPGLDSGNAVVDRASVAGQTILKYQTVGTSTFRVPDGVISLWLLIVQGGASGSDDRTGRYGSGGGGGKAIERTALAVAGGQSYAIEVGAGGANPGHFTDGVARAGNPGAQSKFDTLIANVANAPNADGGASESDIDGVVTARTGGLGSGFAGGGGAGSGANGSGRNGGNGISTTIAGLATNYAGGGSGGLNDLLSTPGAGGGGDDGGAGAANTGGGGAGYTDPGTLGPGAGGSGIVIVRFATQVRTYQALAAFASDVAAATGGILVGEFYRDSTSSAVRQRVS